MAKKPTPAIAAAGQFVALGTIIHNAETYEAGQIIDGLTEAEAAALLAGEAVAQLAPADETAAPAA